MVRSLEPRCHTCRQRQINLSWTAATEDGGTITSYLVERCTGSSCANTPSNFAQVGSSATTAFSDTGLTLSTTYSYRVRATMR